MQLTTTQLNAMYHKAMGMSSITPGFKYLLISGRIIQHMRERNKREYREFIKSNF